MMTTAARRSTRGTGASLTTTTGISCSTPRKGRTRRRARRTTRRKRRRMYKLDKGGTRRGSICNRY
jgi:hypothetical protein